MTPNIPEAGHLAVLNLDAGPRKISREEATQMQTAIAAFIADRWTEVEGAVPANLLIYFPKSVGDPMVDSALNLRLGSWLIEANGTEAVANYRPTPPGNFRFRLALAEPKGKWAVEGVSWEKIMPRR